MNELQIKLTGDISALQSALTKAKATIKSFEESTAKESERGNVGFKRKIGLIESLTNKSKALRTALSQATNENDVARYNQELEQTIKEMTRLNALGRQVQNNIGATSQGFKGAAQNIGSANGVAIEFNRIIQDAPFGLIGIGNNLQQLTANFAQTSKAAGGAGAAIKASLGALISPANLLVLGISAITAAFTAYQMGAFDFLKSNEDAGEAAEKAAEKLDNYRKSLNAVTRASIEGASSAESEIQNFTLLKSQAENANISLKDRIEAVKDLQSKYPDYLGNLTNEQILTGDVGDAYFNLTKEIIATAKARAFSDEIANNSLDLLTKEQQEIERVSLILREREKLESIQASTRLASGQDLLALKNQEAIQQQRINDLVFQQTDSANERGKIEKENLDLQNKITESISNGARFTDATNENILKATESLEFYDSIWNKNEDSLIRNATELNKIIALYEKIAQEPKKLTIEEQIQQQLSGFDPTEKSPGISDEEKEKILETNNILADSFASLGLGIASSMKIGNDSLKGFIMTLISSTPKIISAMRQASAAKSQVAAKDIATNTQVATSEGVSVATKAANALGPVGLALLPVFIGGVLALISSGMKGGGGGGGGFAGGGGASSGKAPQIFTNKVSPPSSSTPNLNSGSIDQANAQSRLFVDVSGDNLRFILDRANERANNG